MRIPAGSGIPSGTEMAVVPEIGPMRRAGDGLQTVHLQSSVALRRVGTQWDDLWCASEVAVPRAQAEAIGMWLDHHGGRLRAVAVEQDGRLVAALPLVLQRLRGILPVLALPRSPWAECGDLLLRPHAHLDLVLDRLVAALCDLERPLWLEGVALEQPRWAAFRAAAARAGLLVGARQHYEIGQVEIAGDWPAYEARRNGDQRRSSRRYTRMLDGAGETVLEIHRDLAPEAVDDLLRRGFAVEERSWKGAQGTAVLRHPDIYEFYMREARFFAERRQLELVFLRHRGQPIAFSYGWTAKGVHFTAKLGYDEAFRKFAPGQQMIMRFLERLHAESPCRLLDFSGPLWPFHETWTTRTYAVGRIIATPRGPVGGALFSAHERWQPQLHRLLHRYKRLIAAHWPILLRPSEWV